MEAIDQVKFEEEAMPIDVLCDGCEREITVGETAYVDKEEGLIYCESCAHNKSEN